MKTWPRVALGELCVVAAGGTPARSNLDNFGGSIPWVKIGDMLQGCITRTEESITELAIKNSSAKILPAGTVLVSIFATIGRTAVLGVDAATNQAIAGLTPRNPELISPLFLRRFLDSIVPELESKAKGVAQLNINSTILRALEIPVPPPEEQQRILRLLDQADMLRAKRREAIAFLGDLTQAIFCDMFGDPRTNLMKWPTNSLGVAAEFRYGTSNKSESNGRPALRIPNVIGGALDLSEIKTVPVSEGEFDRLRLADGDLLFVRTNGNPDYVGRCAVFYGEGASAASNFRPDEFIYASYLIRARLSSECLHPIYMREYLLGPVGRAAMRAKSKTSAGQFNINIQGLGGVPVMFPPLELQERFAERVKRIERLKQVHEAHLAELDALFDSLQHRAFRGELWPEDAAPAA
ncbi:restriction endonuclease subunit S [Streptomyces sp. NPDC002513]